MALVIEVHLICDKCGATFGVDHRYRTGTAQRASARENGWAHGNYKDHCPSCHPGYTRACTRISTGKNYKLRQLCNQHGIRFIGGKITVSGIFNNKRIRIDQFVIEWPHHTLNGQTILRNMQTSTNRPANGWGNAVHFYYLEHDRSKEFSTIKDFIEFHLKN